MSLLFISCSQKEGCMDTYACNYDEIAEIDDGSCIYSHEYYDCEFNCLLDTDFDGICDDLEILGCTDLSACNYSENATENDGLCTYPEMGYDCDGNCLSDYDECGDCEHTYFPEIPSSINILSGGNCFKNQDLNVINKVISLNNLDYSSPLEVGTQTWSEG